MKILHVSPHLGGGVGKAHAALRLALPKDVDQTFLLLEEPRDRRYADAIEAGGAHVVIARGLDRVAELAAAADIVQFEFWNHPRLFECFARCALPEMRCVVWSHISGLFRPVIQPGLIEQAGRFVFTTEASRSIPFLTGLSETARRNISVINSGFGFADAAQRTTRSDRKSVIAYLGTVDFVKMHPGFFDAIDGLDGGEIRVSIWGGVDPSGAVVARAQTMRHPERIHFGGQTNEPENALSGADIFFYPLQPDHYGTAENALVEAMSVGLAPVVLNNPAEMAIVRDGETGFVARSIEECAALLQKLLAAPELQQRIARNAIRHVAETLTPERSARELLALWQDLMSDPKRSSNFRGVVGDCPADWFLATQCLPGEAWAPTGRVSPETRSKGMLAQFESVFPQDTSFSRLAAVRNGVQRRFG
jgi:glycosyltransferase involved in cell wall biosynthesis